MKHPLVAGTCAHMLVAGCTVAPTSPTKASTVPAVAATAAPVLDKTSGQVLGLGGGGGFPPQGPGVDGLLDAAKLGEVGGVALGADGAVYVTDSTNGCVRKIVRKAP